MKEITREQQLLLQVALLRVALRTIASSPCGDMLLYEAEQGVPRISVEQFAEFQLKSSLGGSADYVRQLHDFENAAEQSKEAQHRIKELEGDVDTLMIYIAQLRGVLTTVAKKLPTQECAEIGAVMTTALPDVCGRTQVLVDALEKLARLGHGGTYGNSEGNVIAQNALRKYKGTEHE